MSGVLVYGDAEAYVRLARFNKPGTIPSPSTPEMTDVVRSGPLPAELDSLLAWSSCITDGRPVEKYRSILQNCGFEVDLVERHEGAIGSGTSGAVAHKNQFAAFGLRFV